MIEMDRLMSQWDVFVSPAPGSASLTDHQPDRPSGSRHPLWAESTDCPRRLCLLATFMTRGLHCGSHLPWISRTDRSRLVK
jgi:hypothetical protein